MTARVAPPEGLAFASVQWVAEPEGRTTQETRMDWTQIEDASEPIDWGTVKINGRWYTTDELPPKRDEPDRSEDEP